MRVVEDPARNGNRDSDERRATNDERQEWRRGGGKDREGRLVNLGAWVFVGRMNEGEGWVRRLEMWWECSKGSGGDRYGE